MVDVTFTPAPLLSKPARIEHLPLAAAGDFDVMPDGALLVVDDESAGGATKELRIVLNWFDELRQKMSGGR